MSEDSDHNFLTTIDGVGASVAERLLDRYGSAAAVLDAHIAGLEGVSGVGPTVAENIKETTRRPPESGTTYAETKPRASASKEELTRVEGIGDAVAERLLSRFGTIDAILDAERFELTAVTGVGETVVSNIKTAPVNSGEIQPQSPRSQTQNRDPVTTDSRATPRKRTASPLRIWYWLESWDRSCYSIWLR